MSNTQKLILTAALAAAAFALLGQILPVKEDADHET